MTSSSLFEPEKFEYPVDQWVLPAGALVTACQAYGLDVDGAFDLVRDNRPLRKPWQRWPRPVERWSFRRRYHSHRPVRCDRVIAEFTSSGLLLAGRLAGSDRGADQQLLDQRIRRANAHEDATLGECLQDAWHWMMNLQRILANVLLRMPEDVAYRAAAIAIINELGDRAYRDAKTKGITIAKVAVPQDRLRKHE